MVRKMKWEEPPARRKREQVVILTNDEVAELVAQPGRWCRVRDFERSSSAGNYASQIRNGFGSFEQGKWLARSKTNDDNSSTLWLAYTGGDPAYLDGAAERKATRRKGGAKKARIKK